MISFNPNNQGATIAILRALNSNGPIDSDHATETLRSIMELPSTSVISTRLYRLRQYGFIEVDERGSGNKIKRIEVTSRGRDFINWVDTYPESLKTEES